MGSRFDFESPGAAFVDQMTKTLAQRKVEERQAMLDNLTKAADARAAEEAKQQAVFRTEQMKKMQQEREISRVGALTEGLLGGASVEHLSPEDRALLRTHGKLKDVDPEPIPNVSTDETFNEVTDTGEKGAALESDIEPQPVAAAPIIAPRPKRTVFAGTVAEQQHDEDVAQSRRALGVLATAGDPQSLRNAESLSLIADLNKGVIPKELLISVLSPKQQAIVFNKEKGTFNLATLDGKPLMRQGEEVYQQDPYHAPDRGRRSWPVGKDKDGRTIYADEFGNETIGKNQVGPDPGELPFKIPIGLSNKHSESFTGLMTALEDPADADPIDVATFRKTAKDVLDAAQGVSPKVKRLIQIALQDPAAMEAAYKADPLSVSERNDFVALLPTIIPAEAKAILQANAPKRATPVVPIVRTPAGQASDSMLNRIR